MHDSEPEIPCHGLILINVPYFFQTKENMLVSAHVQVKMSGNDYWWSLWFLLQYKVTRINSILEFFFLFFSVHTCSTRKFSWLLFGFFLQSYFKLRVAKTVVFMKQVITKHFFKKRSVNHTDGNPCDQTEEFSVTCVSNKYWKTMCCHIDLQFTLLR